LVLLFPFPLALLFPLVLPFPFLLALVCRVLVLGLRLVSLLGLGTDLGVSQMIKLRHRSLP
jgi:hypothetical protein